MEPWCPAESERPGQYSQQEGPYDGHIKLNYGFLMQHVSFPLKISTNLSSEFHENADTGYLCTSWPVEETLSLSRARKNCLHLYESTMSGAGAPKTKRMPV